MWTVIAPMVIFTVSMLTAYTYILMYSRTHQQKHLWISGGSFVVMMLSVVLMLSFLKRF